MPSGYRLLAADRVISLHPDTDPAADAVLVWRGRVLTVGRRDDLRREYPELAPVEYPGGVIVPGFNDAHQHPSLVAADLLYLDLSPERTRTAAAVTDAVAAEAARRPAGEWIRGSRYDPTKLAGGIPVTRADLDRAAPRHPVVVGHVSAHWGILNSVALHAAGLADPSQPPPGGVLGRDGTGRLNGILAEQAYFDFAYPCLGGRRTVLPVPGLEDWLAGWRRLTGRLAAAGLTSVTDALVGPDELRLFQEARRRGLLRLRVNALVTHPHLAMLERLGIRGGFGDDRLRLDGIKVILDGSVSAGTCLAESLGGVQVMAGATLRRVVARARRAGWRLAVHANGDRAIRLLLDELDAADARYGAPAVPDRIEHGSMVTPEIVARIARRGMAVTPFGGYVHFHGERLHALYGERLERMFAHRSLIDAGVTVAGASDFPCGPFEPLVAMQSCVTRRSAQGRVLGPSQRITTMEALAVYTVGSARACGEGRRKGFIAPGYLADLTVLGDDPRSVPPAGLAEIPVLATLVGGEEIWRAG